jgi:hypothetical protein
VDVDLFIKKMPNVVKELISREAFDNRRSINQEAIALLEEALLHRVNGGGSRRKQIEALLGDYADSRPGSLGPATASVQASMSSDGTPVAANPGVVQ